MTITVSTMKGSLGVNKKIILAVNVIPVLL